MKKNVAKTKAASRKAPATPVRPPAKEQVRALLAELKRLGSAKRASQLAARFGIHTSLPMFGTTMADMQKIAKRNGRDHALALALWDTDVYEARMLAALVDAPEQVTATQMDRWCAGFDNWAVCDTHCMHLFDRTPHAFAKVEQWSRSREAPLRNAPHTMDDLCNDKWDRPYTREVGCYPAPWIKANKFWPTCGRVDNVYGDRNLVCTCPPIESYMDAEDKPLAA